MNTFTGPSSTPSLQALRDRLLACMEENAEVSVAVLLDLNCPVPRSDLLHPTRLARRSPGAEMVAVRRKDLAHAPDIWPHLVRLRGPNDRGFPDESLLELTLQHAMARRSSLIGSYVCGWVVFSGSLEAAGRQIENLNPLRGRQRRVDGWFEPHRLALMAAMEENTFKHAVLGHFRAWLFVDASGALREIGRDGQQPTPALVPWPAPVDWAAQERVPLARLVLAAMRKAGHSIPAGIEVRIDQTLVQAQANRLVAREDIVCFALNTLTLSPHWHHHPAAARSIADAAESRQSLADAVVDFPSSTLADIADYRTGAQMSATME